MPAMSVVWSVRIPAGIQINDEPAARVIGQARAAAESRTISVPSTAPLEMEWADGMTVIQRPEEFPGARAANHEIDLSREMARGVVPSSLVRVVAHTGALATLAAVVSRADARSSGTDFDGSPQARLVPIYEQVPVPADGTTKSALVLVHGTFSRTEEAFSGLLSGANESATSADTGFTWSALSRLYSYCFGFDHRTLSETPLQNAVHLANQLPEGAQIDFLTHSRGGLVADVFAAAAAPESSALPKKMSPAFEAFTSEFNALRSNVAARGLKVRRVVRVAAPARGTTLAGPRLGTWLNVLLNVAGLATGASATQLYSGIKEFLLALVKEGRSYEAVPGIACMRPDEMFVRWLATLPAAGSLTAITGDASRPGFLERLRTLLPDLFFQDKNDLVIDTAAMVGGPSHVAGATALEFRDEPGTPVNHFAYFKNRTVLDSIAGALGERRTPRVPQGRVRRDLVHTVADAFGGEALSKHHIVPGRDAVIVIPGILGSALSFRKAPLWMKMSALVDGQFRELADLTSHSAIEATGLLQGPYQRLVEDLRRNYSVFPFAFDWRLSVAASAKRLNDMIVNEVRPQSGDASVYVLAHSMGGLVARALGAYHPETWKQIQRVVLLGTPLEGSWSIVDLLLGRDPTLRRLALVDVMHTAPQLLSWIRTFPGVLEMLPETVKESGPSGPLHDKAWAERLGVDQGTWRAAQATRAKLRECRLDPQLDEQKVHYVAGTAKETLTRVQVEESDGESVTKSWVTLEGDGRVTWSSIHNDFETMWLLPAVHGDLADTKPTFGALQQLLSTGMTRDLAQRPTPESVRDRPRPGHRRDGEEGPPSEALEPVLMPTEEELEDALLGRTRASRTPQLVIEVVHGDLAAEDGVVVVGHESGSDLRGAEPSLDLAFGGRLTERLRARRYPHGRGECAVVPYDVLSPEQGNASNVPRAVVIVGLGPAESVSRAHVTEALQTAIVELSLPPFAQLLAASPLETLSFSLVGHREDKLTVEESVGACLDAVLFANRQLEHGIRRVRLVDLYADSAAEALRASVAYARQPGIESEGGYERIEAPLEVTMLAGAERWLGTRPVRRYAAGQLRRINIRSHRCEGQTSIECGVSGDGSSFGRYEQPVRWQVISEHCAVLHTGPLSDESIRALRALVLPEPLHGEFTSGVDLHLVVDGETAAIPWEAFVDAGVRADAPLTTAVSIVRQLSDVSMPARSRTRGAGKALVMCPDLEDDYRLPGAEAEAVEVAAKLRNSGYIVRVARGAPQQLRASLADAYEIVNVAGHGVQQTGAPGRTGVRMMGGDVLSQLDFGYFKSEPPSLVFMSCCHLGQMDVTEGSGSAWASGLARTLISYGVPTVVAAGWAIDDGAALGFAKGFYASVVSGDRLRSSAAKARIAAKEAGGLSTWAAYQVYGNPDFILPTTRGTGGRLDLELESALRRSPVAAHEARKPPRRGVASRQSLARGRDSAAPAGGHRGLFRAPPVVGSHKRGAGVVRGRDSRVPAARPRKAARTVAASLRAHRDRASRKAALFGHDCEGGHTREGVI
jgi:pimeloyl-ACP methyl ester carboxylesterase